MVTLRAGCQVHSLPSPLRVVEDKAYRPLADARQQTKLLFLLSTFRLDAQIHDRAEPLQPI